MESINIFQVDAFTDRLFGGNPAAVCILDKWFDDSTLQSIGAENNFSETAFIIQRDEIFEIRWFTPAVEVDLCGHATLAAAYVVFNQMDYKKDEIVFRTAKNEILRVSKKENLLVLDFPADASAVCAILPEILQGIGKSPLEVYISNYFYLAILENENEVSEINPDLESISKLDRNGLIVSAPGREVDFVSRFFAPQSGINEDPVTGSAHTVLVPYWSKRLKKETLVARQISKRGGTLYCTDKGARVLIGGYAQLYLTGEIKIPRRGVRNQV